MPNPRTGGSGKSRASSGQALAISECPQLGADGSVPEGEGPVPWAEQAGVPAAVPIAVAAALPVRVMVVFDYARWKDQDAALTEIRDVFLKALPGISVATRGCWGPFEDTEGLSSHFDGAAGRLAGVKKIKRIRVDLLTSCAKVLREATGFKPQFMVGLGQGGLVVAALRWPLVVEDAPGEESSEEGSPFRWRSLGRTGRGQNPEADR